MRGWHILACIRCQLGRAARREKPKRARRLKPGDDGTQFCLAGMHWGPPAPNRLAAGRRQQAEEQYEKYINRFGPGAVVYWFGYAAGLKAACPGVLLLDGLPAARDIVTLPCLPLPC